MSNWLNAVLDKIIKTLTDDGSDALYETSIYASTLECNVKTIADSSVSAADVGNCPNVFLLLDEDHSSVVEIVSLKIVFMPFLVR